MGKSDLPTRGNFFSQGGSGGRAPLLEAMPILKDIAPKTEDISH